MQPERKDAEFCQSTRVRSSGSRRFHLLFVPTEGPLVDPKLVFVISAFRKETEAAFKAVHVAAKHHQLEARRVKDEVGNYRITEKILTMIRSARFIVADLTYEWPNVYFELGYARRLAKTVITTVRTGTEVHFDVRDWTYIEYDDSRDLEHDLINRLGIELGRETGGRG